jgi:hypothetical protein
LTAIQLSSQVKVTDPREPSQGLRQSSAFTSTLEAPNWTDEFEESELGNETIDLVATAEIVPSSAVRPSPKLLPLSADLNSSLDLMASVGDPSDLDDPSSTIAHSVGIPASSSFASSSAFASSNRFSQSKGGSASFMFSPSKRDSETATLADSNAPPSGILRPSAAIVQSGALAVTDGFANSVPFVSSTEFDSTQTFNQSQPFTISRPFTASSQFTRSNEFLATKVIDNAPAAAAGGQAFLENPMWLGIIAGGVAVSILVIVLVIKSLRGRVTVDEAAPAADGDMELSLEVGFDRIFSEGCTGLNPFGATTWEGQIGSCFDGLVTQGDDNPFTYIE